MTFDCPRLIRDKKINMMGHFESVVHGFADTLPITRKITQKSGKGENKLEFLAKSLSISAENAHDALADVIILEKVLIQLNVTDADIIKSCSSWEKKKLLENIAVELEKFDLLKSCTSEATRKSLILCGISVEELKEAFAEKKRRLIDLLCKNENCAET